MSRKDCECGGSHHAHPHNPLRQVLKAMTGKEPPAFVKGYNTNGLTDQQSGMLQDWCSLNVQPNWLTGIGLLDAAEQQIQEAISNGNIPREAEQPSELEICAACDEDAVMPGTSLCKLCTPKPPKTKREALSRGS